MSERSDRDDFGRELTRLIRVLNTATDPEILAILARLSHLYREVLREYN